MFFPTPLHQLLKYIILQALKEMLVEYSLDIVIVFKIKSISMSFIICPENSFQLIEISLKILRRDKLLSEYQNSFKQ